MDAARLRELLIYDPDTGVFTWRVTRGSRAPAGGPAGTLHHKGYYVVHIDGVKYSLHRLAWLYVTGDWPVEIDHANLDKADNRFDNLREATRSQNMGNLSKSPRNRSGFKGVSWHKATNMWQAQIMMLGKKKYLGVFTTPEAAHAAYVEAATLSFGDFSRAS